MSKYIVIGNWKMNPETSSLAEKLLASVSKLSVSLKKTEVVVAPPYVFLPKKFKKTKKLSLGAQDAFWGGVGASTGEVSSLQLKKLGVSHVILGHSERRALGETDAMVAKKADAVLRDSLIPVICVGEKERDAHGEYLTLLAHQISDSLAGIQKRDIANVIIAYEPLWAIGKNATGVIDSHGLHQMTIFIQKTLTTLYGREVASKIRIIYGGSVDGSTAPELIRQGNVTGFLVGRASLTAKDFGEILKTVDTA